MSAPLDLERELVILKDHSDYSGADSWGDVDITKRVAVIEYIDASPQSCILTLNARDGYFRTRGPKITHWDRIYLELSDRRGRVTKDVFHVKKFKVLRTKGIGNQIKLICLHESSNLYTQIISKPNRRTSGYKAFEDMLHQLRVNRLEKDPEVIIPAVPDYENKIGIFLDPRTYNDYIFEMRKLQRAIQIIVQKEAQPIELGGSKEFYYFRFKSLYNHATHSDLGKVSPQMIPQGYRPDKTNSGLTNIAKVIIEKKGIDAAPSSLISVDSNLESEQATNIIFIGHKHAGSYPPDYQVFQGELDQHRLIRAYEPSRAYTRGQKVAVGEKRYEAVADIPVNAAPGTGNWKLLSFNPTVDYSPLTTPQYFLNFMYGYIHHADPKKTVGILDHNCVVQHDRFPRLFVKTRETDSARLYRKTDLMAEDGFPPHNFTILVNGTGTGDLGGTDPNGKPLTNSIARYTRPDGSGLGAWYVYTKAVNDLEIIILREGETWVFNPIISDVEIISDLTLGGTGPYIDDSGNIRGGHRDDNGWQKGAYNINDTPTLSTVVIYEPDAHSEAVHAIHRNDDGTLAMGQEKIHGLDKTQNGSAVFVEFNPQRPSSAIAGFNFGFPYPYSKWNEPFGGIVNIGEQIKQEVFDFFNMHEGIDKGRSLIGENIRQFFAIQGFGFFEFFQATFTSRSRLDSLLGPLNALITGGNQLIQWEGRFVHEIFAVDENYNIVTMEYTHDHNNIGTPHTVPITKHAPFRAVLGTSNFVLGQQPEIFNRFDWRKVVYGGITTKDSFDNDGRYLKQNFSLQQGWNRFWLTNKIHVAFDAFRLTKPLVVSNIKKATPPERNIVNEFIEDETVVSHAQAQNYVDSLEPIFAFRREEWILETELRNNVQFADPVYYTDTDLIDTAIDGRANTVKCVVESITYTINKTKFGVGGRIRKIHAVTRFWPTNNSIFSPQDE